MYPNRGNAGLKITVSLFLTALTLSSCGGPGRGEDPRTVPSGGRGTTEAVLENFDFAPDL